MSKYQYQEMLKEPHQSASREKLLHIMAMAPISVETRALDIGIQPNTLTKFLREHLVGYLTMCKIDKYIMENE